MLALVLIALLFGGLPEMLQCLAGMCNYHRPGEEKRMVVLLDESQYDAWLDAPAEEIAQLASDLEASLVVIGTHGRRGVRRLLLGSVAEGVVRLSPCATLVIRPPEAGPVAQIEPPCPECARVRQETKGEDLWCPRHHEHHGRRHVYHYIGRMSGARESLPGLGSND